MNLYLANLVAAVHICYFLFVVGGLIAMGIGVKRDWRWIRNPWFRALHFGAVFIVVFEDVFDFQCPLNTAEWALRAESQPSGPIEATSGIGGALDYLLRHTIPGPVLHAFYWTAAAFLILALFVIPPVFRTTEVPLAKNSEKQSHGGTR